MPRMDGYDAAREMRRLEDEAMAPRTPILALTADAMAEDQDRALVAGMDEHLGKPFRVAELGATVAELIRGDAELGGPDAAGAAAETAAVAAAPAAPILATGRRRVLVVDDNEINRRVALVHLARHDVDTVVAADGPSALGRLAAEPFDLVLLDGMMPVMDGPATAREIRRRELAATLPPIPIVALTASVLPEDRRRMIEAGMDDHVGKPMQPDDVRRVLARWLPRGGSTRTVTIPSVPEALTSREPVAPSTRILDLETFARLSDLGDVSFLDRIVRLFLADAAERVAQVDEGLDTGDLVRLRSALRALDGICGNVGATALGVRTRELQDMIGRREDRGEEPGEEPLARTFGPSRLEPLLEATRAKLTERLNLERR